MISVGLLHGSIISPRNGTLVYKTQIIGYDKCSPCLSFPFLEMRKDKGLGTLSVYRPSCWFVLSPNRAFLPTFMYSLPIFLGELMPNNDPMNFIFDQRCPNRSRDNHRSVEISSRELAPLSCTTPVHKIRFRKPGVGSLCELFLNVKTGCVTCKGKRCRRKQTTRFAGISLCFTVKIHSN